MQSPTSVTEAPTSVTEARLSPFLYTRKQRMLQHNALLRWIQLGAGAITSSLNRIGIPRGIAVSRNPSERFVVTEVITIMTLGTGGLLGCAYAISQPEHWERERARQTDSPERST